MPLDSIERIEVTGGGFSSLWGNFALGDVINIITRPLEPGVAEVAASAGSRAMTRDAVAYANEVDPVRIGVRGDVLPSGGWNIVALSQRGPIDEDVDLDNHNLTGRIDYRFGEHGLAFARATYDEEGRSNGTPFRDSDASRVSLLGGARADALGGRLDGTMFGHLSRLNCSRKRTCGARRRHRGRSSASLPTTARLGDVVEDLELGESSATGRVPRRRRDRLRLRR